MNNYKMNNTVMWIRIRIWICMNPHVFVTLDPDPESAYCVDPESGSTCFFMFFSINIHWEIWSERWPLHPPLPLRLLRPILIKSSVFDNYILNPSPSYMIYEYVCGIFVRHNGAETGEGKGGGRVRWDVRHRLHTI